jgi:hypothetical protein
MIDDDTLIQLLRITAELAEQCRALDLEREDATAARILATLEHLTDLLLKASKSHFR